MTAEIVTIWWRWIWWPINSSLSFPLSVYGACFVRDIDLPCPQQCLFILAITQSGHQLHAPSIWVDGGSRWTKHSFPHITVALSSARKWKQPSKRRCWRGINQPVTAGCVNIGLGVCVWSGWMMTATGQCRFYRVMHRWGQMVANGWNKLQCQWVYFSPSCPLCTFQLISIILREMFIDKWTLCAVSAHLYH